MDALKTQVGGTHYKTMRIQPVEYIVANNIPFREGSVIKYVSRWKSKGGLADLEKAAHFLQMLIEEEAVRINSKDKIYTGASRVQGEVLDRAESWNPLQDPSFGREQS